jgi:hypothetical protein
VVDGAVIGAGADGVGAVEGAVGEGEVGKAGGLDDIMRGCNILLLHVLAQSRYEMGAKRLRVFLSSAY